MKTIGKNCFQLKICLYMAVMVMQIGLTGCHDNEPDPVSKDDNPSEVRDDTTHQGGNITYELQNGVRILSESTLSHVSNWQPDSTYMVGNICQYGSFHVDASVPKSTFPKEGSSEKFIINDRLDVFPEGLLGGVNFIEDTQDGYIVHYYAVKLTDVFKNLNMENQALELSTYAKKVVNRNGRNVAFHTARKSGSVDKYHLEIASGDLDLPLGLSLTPKMVLDLVLKMQMIIEDGQLYTFTSVVESDVTFDAEITASLTGFGVEQSFDICTIYFSAIPLGPLVITPSIDVVGIIGVEGEVKLVTEITYTEKFRSELHYDVNSGLSISNQSIDNPSPFKCETKPKLSGAVKYGLGIGPTIGVYGQTLAVGVTLDCLLQEEVEWAGNFNDFDTDKTPYIDPSYGGYDNSTFLDFGYDSKHVWSLLFQGTAALKGYGFNALRASTPDVKVELDSRQLLPNLSNTYTYEMEGNYLTFHTWIKGKAVTYPNMRLMFYNTNSSTFEVIDAFDFTLSDGQINALEAGADSVQITATGLLSEGKLYLYASPAYEMNGNYYPIRHGYRTSFDAHASQYQTAVKEILKDIRACSAGEWEGCNWEENLSLSDMTNIEFSNYGKGGRKSLSITIPQEWELASELKVGNHCAAIVDSFYWSIECYDMEHPFDKVEILDPCCSYVLTGDEVNTLVMRSKIWDGSNWKLSYIPEQLKTLDISESSIPNFTLPANVRNLEVLKVDNCAKLNNLTMCMHNTTTQISANNCAKLNIVSIDSLRSDYSWTYDCKVLSFPHASIGSLTVSGLSRLQSLYCDGAGLTALSVSNLPNVIDLRCNNNPGLTGVMLPLFDEMFNRGYAPKYDQRYTYNADGTVKSDLGYGFYYADEPERGYHRK